MSKLPVVTRNGERVVMQVFGEKLSLSIDDAAELHKRIKAATLEARAEWGERQGLGKRTRQDAK